MAQNGPEVTEDQRRRSKRVVVAFDGSAASERALAWGLAEAELRHATLHVVSAWTVPATALAGVSVTPSVGTELQRAAEDMLDEALSKLPSGSGVPVLREVTAGQPIPVILRASEGAELLVMGTRGRGPVSGLLLGSVSQYASAHAPCPVVIVHEATTTPRLGRVAGGTPGGGEPPEGREPAQGGASSAGAPAEASPNGPVEAGLFELSEAECLALLGSVEVGRIAIVHRDGRPEIVPVNFVLDGRTVAIRTDSAVLLRDAPLGHVAFEADSIDPEAREGWDVLVTGVATDITDSVDQWSQNLRSTALVPWAPGAKERWIAIMNPSISGRRLRQARRSAPAR